MKIFRILLLAFAFVALVLNCGSIALAQTNPTSVAQIKHPRVAACVAVSGRYTYVAGDEGLWIHDTSNPGNPITITNDMGLGGWPNAIAMRNNYAYIACGYSGLWIYDVSNPSNPTIVSHTIKYLDRTNANIMDVKVSGNYAYLACESGGFGMFDISNPANPIDAGPTKPSGMASAVEIHDNHCYLAMYSGLEILDISNPASPIPIGNVPIGPPPQGIAVSGQHAYLGDRDGGLWIIDISNPAAPKYVTNLYVYYSPYRYNRGLVLSGNYVYMANDIDGLLIHDVSNPANPISVAHAPEPNSSGDAWDVAISGNHAFLANYGDGLRIYSLGTPEPPPLTIQATSTNTLVLSWPTPAAAFAVQQSPALPASNWVTVTNEPVVVASKNQVILPAPTGTMFYRLVSQ